MAEPISAVQYQGDEGGDVGNVDVAVSVHVRVGHVDATEVVIEHSGNECRHVADVHISVAVHVATQAAGSDGHDAIHESD